MQARQFTFYAHYQDKDDLAVSSWTHVLEMLSHTLAHPDDTSQRLLPGRALFQHVQENQHLYRALVRGGDMDLFVEKGQEFWRKQLEERLQALLPPGQAPALPIPVVAQYMAGTLATMLKWWAENKMPYPPEEMAELVERLVTPGARAVLGLEGCR